MNNLELKIVVSLDVAIEETGRMTDKIKLDQIVLNHMLTELCSKFGIINIPSTFQMKMLRKRSRPREQYCFGFFIFSEVHDHLQHCVLRYFQKRIVVPHTSVLHESDDVCIFVTKYPTDHKSELFFIIDFATNKNSFQEANNTVRCFVCCVCFTWSDSFAPLPLEPASGRKQKNGPGHVRTVREQHAVDRLWEGRGRGKPRDPPAVPVRGGRHGTATASAHEVSPWGWEECLRSAPETQ